MNKLQKLDKMQIP